MKSYFWLFATVFLCVSCAHTPDHGKANGYASRLSTTEQQKLYAALAQEIKKNNATHLKECNCMKAFYRNLFLPPDGTARYQFDEFVGSQASLLAHEQSVHVLVMGAGLLLNELSAIANILARGINATIYLTDWAYVFYGDDNFEQKALRFGAQPALIPAAWEDFYFWEWATDPKKEKEYLPFFANYHHAIDEFIAIIKGLDHIYGTKSIVHVLKPAMEMKTQLPHLDLIFSIDSFMDLPGIIMQLHYRWQLHNQPTRYATLNKIKPHGSFWGARDQTIHEQHSRIPVTIEAYDIVNRGKSGRYQLVESLTIAPTEAQKRKGINFAAEPDKDSTQSPFEMNDDVQ